MILNEYTKFEDLISNINSFSDIKISFGGVIEHNGIKFEDKGLPISINEHEFNYMHDFIIKHKLVCGYELATGTGISTLSTGIALKKNGGILISMDNYMEDKLQEQQINFNNNYVLTDSDSYKFVNKILKFYSLDNVELVIGNSPTDSVKIFNDNNYKFDYIFFDCPKCDEDFERDILSIKNNLSDKFAIFVHDTHTFTEKSFKLVENTFGVNMILIDEYYKNTIFHSKRKYPLALITNIEL
jgi:hypothetical protein